MAHYQVRRPTPVKVFPKRVRRQDPATSSAAAKKEKEEAEGLKSPDSPSSSVGSSSSSDDSDSDSDDEDVPSPTSKVEAVPAASLGPDILPSLLPSSVASVPAVSNILPSSAARSSVAVAPTTLITVTPSVSAAVPAPSSAAGASILSSVSQPPPALSRSPSTKPNLGAAPQITEPVISSSSIVSTTSIASVTSSIQPVVTSKVRVESSSILSSIAAISSVTSSENAAPSSAISAQPETGGERPAPQRAEPQEEKTLITKGAAAAAITLSILGALAIVIAGVIFLKRRKRRHNQYKQRLADDAFNPSNTGSLTAPEIVHVDSNSSFLGGGVGGGGGGSHLTRSTNRSDTLFGPGPYERPETVSTNRNNSRFPLKNNFTIPPPQPTPNPFADPPLNKAYDVLQGRPRSTTLTDRGSWLKNPFKNPESERFDPFGELQEKARKERKKHLDEVRQRADAARQADLMREFAAKDKMGLEPPEGAQMRKGSDVTIAGLGVLDRSEGGKYR